MIALVCAFLVAFYFIKIFFPEWFVLQIENERIIKIGLCIDKYWWLYEICSFATSFIIYYFYLGAVKSKLFFNWKELLAIIITIGITHTIYWLEPAFYSNVAFLSFVILPLVCYEESCYKRLCVTISIHFLCQILSLSIRDIGTILSTFNFMTLFIMTLENYFWLLLLFLYFNYNKIFKKGDK